MIRGEFMDLEKKLELYYAKSYIKDDIKKCEATKLYENTYLRER